MRSTKQSKTLPVALAALLCMSAALLFSVEQEEKSEKPASQTPGEAEEGAHEIEGPPVEPPAAPGEAAAYRARPERVTVMDQSDLGPDMRAQSTALQGQELQEIQEISRHRGAYSQLFLFDTPWHGPMLFRPGIAIPLETRRGREKRQAAAAAAKGVSPEAPRELVTSPDSPTAPE